MRPDTLAVHAGHASDPQHGDVTPPLHLSTTYERAADGSYPHGNVYTRMHQPNREELEACVAALEGGAAAAAFASGTAALAALMQALAPGDRVVAPTDAYHGSTRLLREVFEPWGLHVVFADLSDLDQARAAIVPSTRLVLIETPSNPMLKLTDIAAVATLAREAGALSVCDNTWATPLLQRPLDLGCDFVVHSATKYLGGHSDSLGGLVVGKVADGLFARVRMIQSTAGAVLSPFDSWLIRRGLRTLACRMRAHSANAALLAQWLSEQSHVRAVYYPGLPSHAAYALACRQMRGFGGMLAFQVHGGKDRAMAVAAGVRLFTRATSLGGTESLIEHRASVEGPHTRTPDDLLRVSVGLEDPQDLIDDLAQALQVR